LEDVVMKVDSSKLIEEMERPISEGENVFCAGTEVSGETVLVVDYEPDYKKNPGYVQIKFPGGKNKDNGVRNDVTPYDTLCAEMDEELFSGNGKIISYEPFYMSRHTTHTKYFSLMDTSGVYRQRPLIEEEEIDEEGRKSNERIGKPRWEKVSVLVNTMFDGHKPALKALCEYMADKKEEFAWAIVDLERKGF